MPNNVQTTIKIVLISHASKVMFKILQVRLQEYINQELPDVQTGFRKGKGTRDQTANICWIIEKAREFQKNVEKALGTWASVAVACRLWRAGSVVVAHGLSCSPHVGSSWTRD